jgi:hypothetical protein
MFLVPAVLLAVGALLFTLLVRAKDVPEPEAPSPTAHLEQRKAQIYENLRDLQFEYRVGKLSDADYQQTKLTLQKELAGVIGEIERVVKGTATASASTMASPAPVPANAADAQTASAGLAPGPVKAAYSCPHCGAEFPLPLKFCGECGKEMS